MCGGGNVSYTTLVDGMVRDGSGDGVVMRVETLVVFAVKSMNTTSGNFKNRRRSECRTQAIASEKIPRLSVMG